MLKGIYDDGMFGIGMRGATMKDLLSWLDVVALGAVVLKAGGSLLINIDLSLFWWPQGVCDRLSRVLLTRWV
jgi:hypothetical protein